MVVIVAIAAIVVVVVVVVVVIVVHSSTTHVSSIPMADGISWLSHGFSTFPGHVPLPRHRGRPSWGSPPTRGARSQRCRSWRSGAKGRGPPAFGEVGRWERHGKNGGKWWKIVENRGKWWLINMV